MCGLLVDMNGVLLYEAETLIGVLLCIGIHLVLKVTSVFASSPVHLHYWALNLGIHCLEWAFTV
jgi:hypothetical protein